MPAATYHIGLDFGTSQTKVCVQHRSTQPPLHEFFQFRKPDGTSSFYLPSRVSVKADGTLAYGYDATESAYGYFKIAAAEDVGFRVTSYEAGDGRRGQERYGVHAYGRFTPELLSVLFIARVLLLVQGEIRRRERPSVLKGLLGRFTQGAPQPAEVRFTVQLGLPTEYSSRANQLRKRKFETILLLASRLAEEAGSEDAYVALPAEGLVRRVGELNRALGAETEGVEAFEQRLDEAGLSVFPESAAGLTFLVKTGRLRPGYYATMDIGGGSTDVSFFRVNASGGAGGASTSYLASESLLLASNDVYRQYERGRGGRDDLTNLWEGEQAVRQLVLKGEALGDRRFCRAISAVSKDLHRAMYRIFNGRVYRLFDRGPALANGAVGTYREQPCFVYGGGGFLPVPAGLQRIVIHDNGRPDASHLHTAIVREPLARHVLAQTRSIRPDADALDGHVPLLVVAYGLSFPHHAREVLWDERDYEAAAYDFVERPHATNEGCFVYDVVERSWVGAQPERSRTSSGPIGVNGKAETLPSAKGVVRPAGKTRSEGTVSKSGSCPQGCGHKMWLLEHIESVHGTAVVEQYLQRHPEARRVRRTDRYCLRCDTVLLDPSQLRAHEHEQHQEVRCKGCGKPMPMAEADSLRVCTKCIQEASRRRKGQERSGRKHRR